jgi:hypothetical protein
MIGIAVPTAAPLSELVRPGQDQGNRCIPEAVLERRAGKSALILRKLLGRIRLVPVTPDIGKPYLREIKTASSCTDGD